jgi:hypothetical protein
MKIFTALLAILNPLGGIPMFLGLSGSSTSDQRKRIARAVRCHDPFGDRPGGRDAAVVFRDFGGVASGGGEHTPASDEIGMMYGNKRDGGSAGGPLILIPAGGGAAPIRRHAPFFS